MAMNVSFRLPFHAAICLLSLTGCTTSEQPVGIQELPSASHVEPLVGERATIVKQLLLADPRDRLQLLANEPRRAGYTTFPCYQVELPVGLLASDPNAAYWLHINGKSVTLSVQYGSTALACRKM